MRQRIALQVEGAVQGVGFRPFVYKLALHYQLAGWVLNINEGVSIEVEGEVEALGRFCQALSAEAPALAQIRSISQKTIPLQQETEFHIHTSAAPNAQAVVPLISPDAVTCPACLKEMLTPGDRRHRYPFTNCTNCGPRFSIVAALPYDRARTSMNTFAMCPQCAAEYQDPADRRFHAEPIACPVCGPVLQLVDGAGAVLASGDTALHQAVQALRGGSIVAVKGLGGYQLVCDATNEASVLELRRRKRREAKPFALMFPTMADVAACCVVNEQERELLESTAGPIVLLRRLPTATTSSCSQAATVAATVTPAVAAVVAPAVAPAVAPQNPYLGVMLPTTPLHHLLAAELGSPFICTSGNRSAEPIITDDAAALSSLADIADLFLCHNRPVVRPIDDSVIRVAGGNTLFLRRARGYAPTPITTNATLPAVLAVGGHMKNTVGLGLGDLAVLSQHIGDLSTAAARRAQESTTRDLMRFYRFHPEVIACDLHPDYASTRFAERIAGEFGVPILRVQHHHAHIAACALEHALSGNVLGASWDGTGYGPDGTVWGGEFLLCNLDDGTFRRLGSLLPFALPGGEKAVREPRRAALGTLVAAQTECPGILAAGLPLLGINTTEQITLLHIAGTAGLSPQTSSMGRLFDTVAALLGLCTVNRFEGEAAMAVEFAAAGCPASAYPFAILAGPGTDANAPNWWVDWRPMLAQIVQDITAGVDKSRIAARFHITCAAMVVAIARRGGCDRVVLSGGCFQNVPLTLVTQQALDQDGFKVYTHNCVPAGDGGLALGQIAVAAAKVKGAFPCVSPSPAR